MLNTPFGEAEEVKQIIPGVISIVSNDRAMIYLDDTRNDKVPEHLKRKSGWYHEEQEWCIPFVLFEEEIRQQSSKDYWSTIRRLYPMFYVRCGELDGTQIPADSEHGS